MLQYIRYNLFNQEQFVVLLPFLLAFYGGGSGQCRWPCETVPDCCNLCAAAVSGLDSCFSCDDVTGSHRRT